MSGVDSADVNYSFDIGASTSLSSLNVETATVDQSTGVTAIAPALYNFDGDSYFLANFIFGESSPKNTSIIQELTPSSCSEDPQTCQLIQGPIFVNCIADPVPQRPGGACGGSSGQSQREAMYALPDIAFNHPQRWAWTPNGPNMGVSFNYADASNPIASHFYHMKGFFITDQSSAAYGPTRSTATVGEQLQLTARVYNFSLKDTNDASLTQPAKYIYVDFYGQPYCDGNVCGKAFQIGEAKLAQPIPGFKSRNLQGPNWILASVPFDTSGLPPGPMVFWVVTWMEDANGNRVQEITDHGLTAIPAENLTSIGQVPIEEYSNNVGIYGVHTQFQLLPPAAPGASPSELTSSGALKSVAVAADSQVNLDSYLNIVATLQASENPINHLSVSYFDGNPNKGGVLFDHQVVHHINANARYVERTSLQMNSCGTHQIFAEVLNRGSAPTLSEAATVKVGVDPVTYISGMMTFLEAIQMPRQEAENLKVDLQAATNLFQNGKVARGMEKLASFGRAADRIAYHAEPQMRQKLAVLSNQAQTINSCEAGPAGR